MYIFKSCCVDDYFPYFVCSIVAVQVLQRNGLRISFMVVFRKPAILPLQTARKWSNLLYLTVHKAMQYILIYTVYQFNVATYSIVL